jgi:regulator of sigma E protease
VDRLISALAAIIAIGVLIILHEAGHFWVARRSGMRVRRFSIGFGPPLASIVRGGTEYRIGTIPLGGYVQVDGLSPNDGSDPSAPDNYLRKPAHLRAAMILAGPAANFVIGLFLFLVYYAAFLTVPLAPVRVLRVVEGTPAEAAGIHAEDLIVGTSSTTFTYASDLLATLSANGPKPIQLAVKRGDASLMLRLVPEELASGRFRIGVEYEPTGRLPKPLGLEEGAKAAVLEAFTVCDDFLKLLGGFLHPGGKPSGGEITGPIGIVGALAPRLKASWTEGMDLIGQISIILGFVNLLPIPALDGSRLLFLLVGVVRRKPISPRLEVVVHTVGLVLLLGLMVLVSIRDVGRLLR